MKTIIITGPSGSGKSYLSKKLSKLFNNTIVLKTDSYYKDNIFINFLSICQHDIYDRPFSFKKNEIMKTLKCIYNKDRSITSYKYNFKRKDSSKSKVNINYEEGNQFLILEGIFAHRLDLNYKETINIVCAEEKGICFKRRLKRDQLERGREINEVYQKFDMSWYLYYKHVHRYLNYNDVFSISTQDKISYNKLVLKLEKEKKIN